jgi:hypothetical protein
MNRKDLTAIAGLSGILATILTTAPAKTEETCLEIHPYTPMDQDVVYILRGTNIEVEPCEWQKAIIYKQP